MTEEEQRAFQLQRIYVKDVSFEAPGTPRVFLDEWNPEINVQLNNEATAIAESTEYEVSITVTVTATQNDKTVYLAELCQAGVFTIQGMEGEELDQLLGAYCPSVLFPYLREALSDLIGRASFPPFLMQPINFDALYRDARNQRENGGEGGATAH